MSSVPVRKARLASCIVYRKEIISFGTNQLKSHPFQSRFGKNSEAIFLHSETDAIKNALRLLTLDELAKASLLIVRLKYAGTERKAFVYGLAKPCAGCERAIRTFGIRKVLYTQDDGRIGQL